MDVTLQKVDGVVIPSGMLVIAYDLDQEGDSQKKELLGKLWMNFKIGNPKYTQKIQLPDNKEAPGVSYVYRKPKWWRLTYGATNEESG